jgi:hypothetical protein
LKNYPEVKTIWFCLVVLFSCLVQLFFYQPSNGVSHQLLREGLIMSESTSSKVTPTVLQRVLDDNSLLLFLCITVPTVFYILWGVMEVLAIPMAK